MRLKPWIRLALSLRRRDERSPRLALLAIDLGCGFLWSCAAQSPPRPPRIERPVAVRNLTAEQVGTTIQLRFTPPGSAIDGELLTKPLEVEIFRDVASSSRPGTNAKAPPVSTAPSAPLTILIGAALSHRAGGVTEYVDQFAPAEFQRLLGATLMFRVRALTRGFRGRPIAGELSNPAEVALLDVPLPVENVTVEVTEKALNLRWPAPSKTVSGQPAAVAGYRVYRSDSGKSGPYRRLGEASEPSYADTRFEFGHLYSYKVRAVSREDGHTSESVDSAPVEIMPRDVFPPAVPAGLTGLYTAGAVQLIWNPGTEPDLAGYNIYRRETGGGRAERLNTELLRSPLYRDTTAMPGQHYQYSVTAVDLSGNESAPSAGIEVEVPPAP